ncbi:hypothetical protein K4L44_01340 [Halosquirtibacter laminarini]|uniref:Uncharacterized protein n=1 Tax=Halosquirtibacter laminarini TaxID=3374600 RepID=A0AC61NG66_9BACT|nr:hypothetical protein K4L44_01340 [Prolixibacteraceae bacterium]
MVNQNDDTRIHGVIFSIVGHIIILLLLYFIPLEGSDGGAGEEYVVLVDNSGVDRVAQARPKHKNPPQKNDKIATASQAQAQKKQKKIEKIHKSTPVPKQGKSYKNKSNEGEKKENPKVNNSKTTDINSVKKAEEEKKQREEVERQRVENIKRKIEKRKQDSIRKVQEKIIQKQQAEMNQMFQQITENSNQPTKTNATTNKSDSQKTTTKSSKHRGLSVKNRVFITGAEKPTYLGSEAGKIHLLLTVNPSGHVSKVTVEEGSTTITSQKTIDSAIAFVKTLRFNTASDQYDYGYYELVYKNGGVF